MEIQLLDKRKKEVFIAIFHTLKAFTSSINIVFSPMKVVVQGMDRSHVCLFYLNLYPSWFDKYVATEEIQINVDANLMCSTLSTKSEGQPLVLAMNPGSPDVLYMTFERTSDSKKGTDFKKCIKLPLLAFDHDPIMLPEVDYEAEFTIASKQLGDLFSQLGNFGEQVCVQCGDDGIRFLAGTQSNGEMTIDVPLDDLESYGVIEGETVQLIYSLGNLSRMCVPKVATNVDVSLSRSHPMKVSYSLGGDVDESSFVFYMATMAISSL